MQIAIYRPLLLVPETAKKCSCSHKHDVQPESAVIFIRQARMGAIGMKHLEQPVDVVLSVLCPFVAVFGQKAKLRQPRAAILGGKLLRLVRAPVEGNRVKQSFEKRTKLGIGGGPIASGMRFNSLGKMANRLQEAEVLQQLMNLIVDGR